MSSLLATLREACEASYDFAAPDMEVAGKFDARETGLVYLDDDGETVICDPDACTECGEKKQLCRQFMKALTLWQPWASAISLGAKRIETRSWSTRYRGPIAIHAAKRNEYKAVKNYDSFQPIFRAAVLEGYNPAELPAGAFVAVADLVDCVPVEEMNLSDLRDPEYLTGMVYREFDLGDYSPGRYGWILENVRPLPEPIPYRGRQGLWNVPDGVLDA